MTLFMNIPKGNKTSKFVAIFGKVLKFSALPQIFFWQRIVVKIYLTRRGDRCKHITIRIGEESL